MPHRGRLNLLTGLLEYSPAALFHKIRGGSEIPEELGATGDVISHLVASPSLAYADAEVPIKVSLLPNPSHLEAVNPVALGKTRAKQYSLLRTNAADCMLGDRAMCVQLHGDASFAGQGVVMESLGLSACSLTLDLRGWLTPYLFVRKATCRTLRAAAVCTSWSSKCLTGWFLRPLADVSFQQQVSSILPTVPVGQIWNEVSLASDTLLPHRAHGRRCTRQTLAR
jgi:hypothetical protein